MFVPNTSCQWLKKAPVRSLTGKETFASPRPLPCSIVRLDLSRVPTTVRADSSASRGAAEQMTAAAVILVPPHTKISHGDVLRIQGVAIEVSGMQPRLDVSGQRDHIELTGDIRAEI